MSQLSATHTAAPAAGRSDASRLMMFEAQKKSAGIAYALWFFLGMTGAHRFYAGSTGPGIAMLAIFAVSLLLSVVGIGLAGIAILGIWALVDAFLIPGMIRDHNTKLAASLA